jgi:hypothetical protein
MRLVSPWKPSLMTVMSTLTMSPGLELLVAGNAVAHDVVDRRADRRRIRDVPGRRVVERSGNRLLRVAHVLVAQPVELAGRHPGLHVRGDVVEHLGREPPGNAHLRDVVCGFEID